MKKILASTVVATAMAVQGNSQGNSFNGSLDEAIHPFRVNISQDALDDLKRRILATNWPDKETVSDVSQGVQLATIQELARYWVNNYDWRKVEAKLNSYPQFITKVDGVDINFIHVKSKHKGAKPILIAHGWPGSVIEQLKIIDPLVNPTAFGGKAEDAFDVVIPNMPGYGYSGKPTEGGWEPRRIAAAYVTLMKRLGYDKFFAQGGDWGAVVVDYMAIKAPENLLGIHTNMAGAIPDNILAAASTGAPTPAGLSAEERRAYEQLVITYKNVGYAVYMGWHPQTMIGVADSPVALAALLIDHDLESLKMITRSFNGVKEGLTRDDVLDNISYFWFTNSGISAGRLYWENKDGYFNIKGVTKVPVVVSAFPDELYQLPKSWAEKAYPKLVYYNRPAKGGHFAAWEQPEYLVQDIRNGFRSLR
jgi:pimeloyl-ACP methyl ester carboxylesterase